MTDERLRTLEREAATGDVAARARLLRERERVGELPPERLRLGAALGDAAARLALADSTGPITVDTTGGLVEALEAHGGREGLVRAALAAATVAAPRWVSRVPLDARPVEALAAARRSLERGDADPALSTHLEAATSAARLDAWELLGEHPPETPPDEVDAADGDAYAAVFAARAARAALLAVTWWFEGASLYSLARYARDALFDGAGAVGQPDVLEAVRRELLPWTLP